MPSDPVIHIVDDDEAVLDSLEILLTLEGLTVRGYGSAQALLDSLPANGRGCVVTDVHMKGMGGLELLRCLRAVRADLPVIVTTGRPYRALAAEVEAAGGVALLEKPFEPRQIIEAVRAALN